jgi:gamma-glutamyltranspeptidase/glutathione hydrolase
MVIRSQWILSKKEVVAKTGMVTTSVPEAAEAGLKMLRRGGNAVDAAVAAGFCNTVLEPYLACLGGLGFMVLYLADQDQTVAVDFNARAPQMASPDMYNVLAPSAAGGTRVFEVENGENSLGGKAVTVPATCAGLCLVHELYGRLPREAVLAPAISLASEGFIFGWDASLTLNAMMRESKRNQFIDGIWFPGGFPLAPGARVVQTQYGKLLKRIAEEGSKAVYEGEIAGLIEKEVLSTGGVLTREDLARYEPRVSPPMSTSYRDYTICTVPTPSGGITLLEFMNILENFDLESMGPNSTEYLHTFIESTRHAFADRYRFLGDWDYASVPLEGLLSKNYAKEIASQIRSERTATEPETEKEPWDYYLNRVVHNPWKYDSKPSLRHNAGSAAAPCEGGTTHINVVDRNRNVVSCTHTPGFTAGVAPQGTGFYLAGAMGWFIPEPGHVNSIAGWKRPLMNMAPLMVLKDGLPFLSQGAPGARRIISRNAQVVLNVLEFNMGIQQAVETPTLDASGRDTLVDSRIDHEAAAGLQRIGHRVKIVEEAPGVSYFAHPSGILIDQETGLLYGGVEPFRRSTAIGY